MGKWEGHGPFLVCRSWKSPWEGCHVFSWTTPTSLPGMEGLKRKERGACLRDPHQEPPFLELMHLGHPVSSSSLCFWRSFSLMPEVLSSPRLPFTKLPFGIFPLPQGPKWC